MNRNCIRTDRSLRRTVDYAEILCLRLKHTDKLLPDDLTLSFGSGHAAERLMKPFVQIYADELQFKSAALAKPRLDFVALVLSRQTVIDEHTDELFSDRPCPRTLDRRTTRVCAGAFARGYLGRLLLPVSNQIISKTRKRGSASS